jgi:hypothetical protein
MRCACSDQASDPVTAGPSASADLWEPRYQDAGPAWGRQPNARLVTVLPGWDFSQGGHGTLECRGDGPAEACPYLAATIGEYLTADRLRRSSYTPALLAIAARLG